MINNQYESDPYLVDLSVRGFWGELTDPAELNMYWSYAATLLGYGLLPVSAGRPQRGATGFSNDHFPQPALSGQRQSDAELAPIIAISPGWWTVLNG